MVRALLCQAAAFHAPADLVIMVCTSDPDGPAWSRVKWLPHAHHPVELDHAGPVRLIDPALQVLEDHLGPELTRRSGFNPQAPVEADMPHVVVVLDDAHLSGTELLVDPDGLAAVTVIDLDGRAEEVVRDVGVSLELDGDEVTLVRRDLRQRLGRADALAVPVAEALARQLAGFRLAAIGGGETDDPTASELSLPSLLGRSDAGALDLDVLWRPRPLRDRLRVPIGITPEGDVIDLDLKESAQDGMGPHGILVGATGSGKTELLRTLVLGLAATHPPDVPGPSSASSRWRVSGSPGSWGPGAGRLCRSRARCRSPGPGTAT
jgi:S-DNA-T family DNA segregation ATPase FtsK/SpoIIIE